MRVLRVRRQDGEGGLRLLRHGHWQDDGLLHGQVDDAGLVLRDCWRHGREDWWRCGHRHRHVLHEGVHRQGRRREGRLRLLRRHGHQEGRVSLRHDVSLQMSTSRLPPRLPRRQHLKSAAPSIVCLFHHLNAHSGTIRSLSSGRFSVRTL